MENQYQHLLVETTARGVRTITLNRPEKLNAINMRLAEEIIEAINAASADDTVKVLVLTGAGRGFCAGLDLDPANVSETMAARTKSRAAQLDDLGWVGRQALAITGCDKPVIAAINGPAAGAGLGLALAADIRLLQANAVLTTGYIRRGLSPDAGVSYFLPRLVGSSRAADLILTARDIRPDESDRIGLVSQVLSADDFGGEVDRYADQLAGGPPLALTLTKRLLVSAFDTDLTSHLKTELAFIQQCFATQDVTEAMKAYLEKRQPNFKGR